MAKPVDIYKCEDDRSIKMDRNGGKLEDAKLTVKILAKSTPGDYLIFSPETGGKLSSSSRNVRNHRASLFTLRNS